MFLTKFKIATAIALAVVVLAAGSAVLTPEGLAAQLTEPFKAEPTRAKGTQINSGTQPNEDASRQYRTGKSRQKEDDNLKNTLWALEERRSQAMTKGDWETQQNFLADDFIGVSARAARSDKAAIIEGAKRLRCVDWKTRDVEVRRVSKDVAVLTYIYGCEELSPEGAHIQTLRDHRASLVWAQRNGGWVIVFCQETVLPGGE